MTDPFFITHQSILLSQVYMLTWNVPKEIQKQKVKKQRFRSRDPPSFTKPLRRRDTGVLHLKNVSATTHAGEYKCVVVYKGRGRKRPFVIKIVKLQFPEGALLIVLDALIDVFIGPF